jgi:hypothetical protein
VLKSIVASHRVQYSLERTKVKPVPWAFLHMRDVGLPQVYPGMPNLRTNKSTALPLCRPSDVCGRRPLPALVLTRMHAVWNPR